MKFHRIIGVFLASFLNCLGIQEGDPEAKVYLELGQPSGRIVLPSGVTILSYEHGEVVVKNGLIQKVKIISKQERESDIQRTRFEQIKAAEKKQAELRDKEVRVGLRSPWEPDSVAAKGVFVESFNVINGFMCVLRNNSEDSLKPAQVTVRLSSKTNAFEPFVVRLHVESFVPQILPGESITYFGGFPEYPQRRKPENFNDTQVSATISVYSGSTLLGVNQSTWSRNYRLHKGEWLRVQTVAESK